MKKVFNEWTARGLVIMLIILLASFSWPHQMLATVLIVVAGGIILFFAWVIGLLIRPSDTTEAPSVYTGSGIYTR